MNQFEATNQRMSMAVKDDQFGGQLGPKHAQRMTIDGANTSLNFKDVGSLDNDASSFLPNASTSNKQTFKRLLGSTIPE